MTHKRDLAKWFANWRLIQHQRASCANEPFDSHFQISVTRWQDPHFKRQMRNQFGNSKTAALPTFLLLNVFDIKILLIFALLLAKVWRAGPALGKVIKCTLDKISILASARYQTKPDLDWVLKTFYLPLLLSEGIQLFIFLVDGIRTPPFWVCSFSFNHKTVAQRV